MLLIVMFAGMLVSMQLRNKLKSYASQPLTAGLSGKETAEKMLHDNGIYDVSVISSQGFLTDHYNPLNKTVNLSPDVYKGRNIASAAVAAHECGHAVQHVRAYSMLMLRSRLVPVVQFSSSMVQWILLAGIFAIALFQSYFLLLLGIILFSLTTLFSLITLPVEFDASRRGLAWLDSIQIALGAEHEKARKALKWAAMTYVIAAISSVLTLLYYIMIFLGGRSRN